MNSDELQSFTNKTVLSQFIDLNPFATIILGGKDLLTTHIPIFCTNEGNEFMLHGHIAKDNPQYKYLEEGKNALIIFESIGPGVSAFSKEELTNEYSAVHINGQIMLQSEKELKISLIKTFKILRKFYNYKKEEYPINDEVISRQLNRVTGFYCKPSLINPILKLNQFY